MRKISVDEMQKRLDSLLDEVASEKEFEIHLNGKPVACLTRALPDTVIFPDRSELRASPPPIRESASQAILGLRDNERY